MPSQMPHALRQAELLYLQSQWSFLYACIMRVMLNGVADHHARQAGCCFLRGSQ
jgi:hypothetical protein